MCVPMHACSRKSTELVSGLSLKFFRVSKSCSCSGRPLTIIPLALCPRSFNKCNSELSENVKCTSTTAHFGHPILCSNEVEKQAWSIQGSTTKGKRHNYITPHITTNWSNNSRAPLCKVKTARFARQDVTCLRTPRKPRGPTQSHRSWRKGKFPSPEPACSARDRLERFKREVKKFQRRSPY